MPEDTVAGYKFAHPGDKRDGEIAQIIARVDEPNVLAEWGCSFYVWFPQENEVKLVKATRLQPWFDC